MTRDVFQITASSNREKSTGIENYGAVLRRKNTDCRFARLELEPHVSKLRRRRVACGRQFIFYKGV